MHTVWIVSYYDKGDPEATVTAFDNKRAAADYYTHILNKHEHLTMDECVVYDTFEKGNIDR